MKSGNFFPKLAISKILYNYPYLYLMAQILLEYNINRKKIMYCMSYPAIIHNILIIYPNLFVLIIILIQKYNLISEKMMYTLMLVLANYINVGLHYQNKLMKKIIIYWMGKLYKSFLIQISFIIIIFKFNFYHI